MLLPPPVAQEEDWQASCPDGPNYCPPIYIDQLVRAKAADGGELFARALDRFNKYLAAAQQQQQP